MNADFKAKSSTSLLLDRFAIQRHVLSRTDQPEFSLLVK